MKVHISDIKVNSRLRDIDQPSIFQLAESIRHIGLLQPILINQNNDLIAGNHRLEAHKLLNIDEIECIVVDFDKITGELGEIDENLIRRELDVIGQGEHLIRRDEILNILGLRAKKGDNQYSGGNGSASITPPKTSLEISNEVGISKRNYYLKKQIVKGLTDYVKGKLRNTEWAVSTTGIQRLSKEESHIQNRVVDGILTKYNGHRVTGQDNKIKDEILIVKGEITKNNLIDELGLYKNVQFDDRCRLINDDLRNVQIESSSIQLLFTDPPYTNFSFYEWLGDISSRCLKNGGLCVCYTSVQLIPKVIEVMSNYLDYHWCASIVYKQGISSRQGPVFNAWKPLLIWRKKGNTPKYNKFQDTHQIELDIDKSLHPWQQPQPETDYLISHLSSVGDTILDTFSGTNTTGVSCIKQGRRYIGIEQDKETFKIGKSRLQQEFNTLQKN